MRAETADDEGEDDNEDEYQVRAGHMKTLVVFYSRTGTTRRLAEVIAAELSAGAKASAGAGASADATASVDIEEIVDKKSRKGALGAMIGGWDATFRRAADIAEPEHNPAGYDLVVIGTPVWAWTMTPAVRAYLERQKGRLPQVALFALAASSGADKTVAAMAKLAGKKPRATLALTRGRGLGDEMLEQARRFAAGLIPAP